MIEIDCLEDICVNGRIIIKTIFSKLGRSGWTGFIWHSIRTLTPALEKDIMNPRVLYMREFLDCLTGFEFFKDSSI